jgi:hypothetical protein
MGRATNEFAPLLFYGTNHSCIPVALLYGCKVHDLAGKSCHIDYFFDFGT